MEQLEKRILEIFAQQPLAVCASITLDGKPWVRYVAISAEEDLSIRFATFAGTRKVEQIRANPEVHLTCGVESLSEMKPYLQVQGLAEFSRNKTLRHDFWNPMLEHIFKGPDDPNYGVVVVKPYRIECTTPGSMVPEIWTVAE